MMASSREASRDRGVKGEGSGYWSLGDSSQTGTGVETGTRGGETGIGVRGDMGQVTKVGENRRGGGLVINITV